MIDTDALRKKVLDLAIQGRLTEQLSSDGNAEELYAKIQEEKARLIKEGKIKKEKPLPAITGDENPFEIPENWKWVRLQEIVSLLGDGIHGTPEYDDNGKYYFINGNNLSNGKIVLRSNTKKVNEIEYNKYRNELNENTVLVSINGTIGNVAFYFNERIILGKSACYFNLLNNKLKEYVFYLLQTDYFLKYANYKATGVTIKNVSLKAMNELSIPLPPLEEQNRIVETIKEIFSQIAIIDDLQSKYIKDSAALKSKILDAAIRGRLVEQRTEEGTAEELYKQIQAEKQKLIKEGKIKKEKPLPEIDEDEIPFDIPESWKWVHLNNIATISLGKTLNKTTDTGEELPYLCSINVYFEGINLDKIKIAKFDLQEKEKYRLQKGDLLICEGGDAGRSAIWDSDEEMYYQNALHRVRFFGNISARYMCFVLECYKKNGIIANYTRGVGIQHLVQSSLNSIWLPLPPLAEQRRIVAKIEELLPLCERLAECREKA